MTGETEPQGSGCAGVLVALAVAGTVGTVAWAAAPAVLVLVIWSAGALALWWAVSRPPAKIDNPSPPPPAGESGYAFSLVEDRPGHWAVQWPRGEVDHEQG